MSATITEQAALILGGADDALVELRAIHPRLKDHKRRDWFGLRDLDRLPRRAAMLTQSYNVWLSAAPRRDRGGTADDVAYAACLWADCDTAVAVAALRAFRPVPTLVVRSSTLDGERLQAWWGLTERLASDEIEAPLRRLAAALGSDTSVCDRARVLRAVGTTNHKRARPEPVEAVHFTGEVHALDTVLASASAVPSVSTGAGCGEYEAPAERVPHGQRHPYLKGICVRLLKGGITDPDCIEHLMRAEFERICDPEPAPAPGYFREWAKWAAKTDIARRESNIAEIIARWKSAA
jgi:hypothetical protein